MSMSNRPFLVVACTALLGFGPPATSQQPLVQKAGVPQSDLAELKAKIVDLEQQVARQKKLLNEVEENFETRASKFERRILDLARKLDTLEQSHIADAMEQRPKRPSNWIPRTFNGQEYFIVPCKDDKEK